MGLKQNLKDNILLVLAKKNDQYVAGALNFIGSDCLYGRYWGCNQFFPAMHFELCYYKAIETAIKLKLNKVEAGAQGPHKIKRGYIPTATYSAHFIFNEELSFNSSSTLFSIGVESSIFFNSILSSFLVKSLSKIFDKFSSVIFSK